MCMQVPDDPNIELMLRVKRGDEEAFELLCEQFRRQLTGFFYSLCWNYHASEDCAQEVLLKVWLARDRYEAAAKFSTYLFRIARNHWFATLRTRKCRPEPLYLEETWQAEASEDDLGRLLISRYVDRRIRQAVSELPDRYRLVFVLSHFQDMKYAEIAEVLEIPVGTVKSRMSTAVRMLREELREEMAGGHDK